MCKGFPQIAAQERALRFERRRHEQIVTPLFVLTSANPAQSPSQPRVAERAVGGDGLVEGRKRVVDPILRGKDKSLERDGLSIARRQMQCVRQRVLRGADPAKAELQFRHPCPAEAELRRKLHRPPGCLQCSIQVSF
jgi:hypothetical protein